MSISWNIQTYACLDSTQKTLKELAESGAPEGMVIHAQEQAHGVGRHGRSWISEPGNFFMSLLLKPECPAQDIGQLSLLSGLAVARTLQEYLPDPGALMLKWPNDILLEGRKCAGLLLETGLKNKSDIDWVALGIGVNLTSAPAEGACLKDYVQKVPSVEMFRDQILIDISHYYLLWKSEGMKAIKPQWLDLAHGQGTRVSVKIGSKIESGEFYDIDERGSLLLSHDSGQTVKTITAGDVYL